MAAPKCLVSDIMRSPVITVDKSCALDKSLAVMRKFYIRRLPVVDEKGKLIGIVTDRDLRLAANSPFLGAVEVFEQLSKHTVEDIMKGSLITIEPEAPIVDACKLMRISKVGGLPVVDNNGALCGIISTTDLIDHLVRILEPLPITADS